MSTGFSFTVASYNVLADAHVQPDRYPGVRGELLVPGARLPGLLRYLDQRLPADVICLQEVEADVFDAVQAHLAPKGYQGRLALKRHKPDGCATFVRTSHLALQSTHALDYRDHLGDGRDSGHVALTVLLERAGWPVGVINTHLKWHPAGTAVTNQWAYRQVTLALQERQRLAPSCPNWVLCGDFNVTPDSEVVRQVREAGLLDAYGAFPRQNTCAIHGRPRRIDFLFHSPTLLAFPAELPPLFDDTVMPSASEPSDHLGILARFEG
jgi:mRNA deadenylase 3'-5' endonuclease subunit Ccr4